MSCIVAVPITVEWYRLNICLCRRYFSRTGQWWWGATTLVMLSSIAVWHMWISIALLIFSLQFNKLEKLPLWHINVLNTSRHSWECEWVIDITGHSFHDLFYLFHSIICESAMCNLYIHEDLRYGARWGPLNSRNVKLTGYSILDIGHWTFECPMSNINYLANFTFLWTAGLLVISRWNYGSFLEFAITLK